MRMLLLLAWLTLPLIGWTYHQGPGQERLMADDASRMLATADQLVAEGKWEEAVQWFDSALKNVPESKVDEGRRIRLALANARMQAKMLPVAHQELKGLLAELMAEQQNGATPSEDLIAETRSSLAASQYYMTWLMRLEGLPRETWGPEIDAARQSFRLLAEQSLEAGETEAAQTCQEDLESVVRLARMDLSDLQGLPLPSQ